MQFGRSQRIHIVLVAATLLPIAALSWLSARVLTMDSALEWQRNREQLDFTGSKVALAIERRLEMVEDRLMRGGGLVFTPSGISATSHPGVPGVLLPLY